MAALTIRGYARHRGVSHTAVRKALAAGRISADADGNIDPVQADEQWASSTNLSKPKNSVTGVPKLRREPAAPPTLLVPNAGAEPISIAPGDGGAARLVASYAASRAARESYAARLAKLEFERATGLVVALAEVRKETFEAFRAFRDAMEALPERMDGALAAESDPARIRQILRTEIRKVLADLEAFCRRQAGLDRAHG